MTSKKKFEELIGTLSRASAQAVSTEHDTEADNYSDLKEYLYVKTEVESAFVEKANECTGKRIIFLCGSSGDGKSEILTRHSKTYMGEFKFHLDATHSFQPDQDAIDALDNEFDEYSQHEKSLIVGINTGMLFNYASHGGDRHSDIKRSISRYLNGQEPDDTHIFINFKDHPKFVITEGRFRSDFIENIMDRLTSASSKNPIYQSFQSEKDTLDPQIKSNFRLLQDPSVREIIITVLLKARLKYDQFLTARTILDLLHHLILGPGYIFDNLFNKGHNELVDVLSHFDPCSFRTQELDQFLIERSLKLNNSDFMEFEKSVNERYGIRTLKPGSWVRALYLMQGLKIGNNFHKNYISDFKQKIFDRYVQIWELHNSYTGDVEQKQRLRSFYREEMVKSLLYFTNRLTPSLTKKSRVFVAKRGRYVISAPINVVPNLQKTGKDMSGGISSFKVHLRVNEQDISPFSVNINFLELLEKISSGYRPNVHDKNTVALLETVVEHFQQQANQSVALFIEGPKIATSMKHYKEDDEIMIGEVT